MADPSSRAEWLVQFQHEYGTDALLNVIYESRVGVSNAFTNPTDMNFVIRTAQKMIERGQLHPTG